VPTLRGVILLDANGPAANVSGDPPYGISTLIRRYARAGFKPGGAALYDGHYFLPIVNGRHGDRPARVPRRSAGGPVARPGVRDELSVVAVLWAWRERAGVRGAQRGDGAAGPVRRLERRARLLQLRYTEPTAANKLEADGSRFTFTIESAITRSSRREQEHRARARLRYELTDAASDAPRIAGFASVGAAATGLAVYDTALYDTDCVRGR
jgi:hypothetical protein